jgi:hypothetical protein
MAPALSPFFQDHSFDPFLFAAIGEERNGMLLSVLSALARLDLDPWFEAASLSRLPAPAATQRLTALLSSLPSAQLKAPAPATIMRLVGLLPQAAKDTPSRGGAIVAKSKLSWPAVALIGVAFAMMFTEQYASRHTPEGSGVASLATSVSDPDVGKPMANSLSRREATRSSVENR